MKPKWIHDCPRCKYLGSMFMPQGVTDWYECEGFDKSVVARHGDDGWEYWSMTKSIVEDDRYLTARRASDDTKGFAHMQVLARFMLKQGELK